MTLTADRFVALDGLRGIAAVMVLAAHLPPFLSPALTPRSPTLAVDFFFVLSGFVISHAYGDRLATGLSPARFMLMRIVRLYPLFGLATLAAVLHLAMIAVIGEPQPFQAPLQNLLLLPSLRPDSAYFPLNAPAWSLAAEILINAVYAATLRWQTAPRLLGVMAVSAAILVVLAFIDGDTSGGSRVGEGWMFFGRVTFGFSAGLLIYKLYRRGFRFPAIPVWPLYLLVALMLFAHIPEGIFRSLYGIGAVLVAAPVIVLAGASAATGKVGAPFAQFSGQISYPVYIIHFPLITMIYYSDPIIGNIFLRSRLYSGPMLIVVFVMLSWILAVYYDKPVRRMLGALIKTPASRLTSSAF